MIYVHIWKTKVSWEFWESPSKQEVSSIHVCLIFVFPSDFLSSRRRFSEVSLAFSNILQSWGDLSLSSCSLLINTVAINLFSCENSQHCSSVVRSKVSINKSFLCFDTPRFLCSFQTDFKIVVSLLSLL